MKFIKDTNWQEVFEGWKSREADNPGWIECATKIKGWPNWESWRSFTAEQIKANSRIWKIYQFENPLKEIPEMLVGPFTGWQSRFTVKNTKSFADLLEIPNEYEEFSKHSLITSMLEAMPFQTELIGMVRKDLGKIICLDGHHRAVTISLAAKKGKEMDFSNQPISIALADLDLNELDLMDRILERGTAKII